MEGWMRWLVIAGLGMAVASCDGAGPPSRPVEPHGGTVLAHPRLVPIFFADDPDIAVLTRFSRWIVNSRWLAAVGAEYGVGGGSVLAVLQRGEPAPASITDAEIVDLVFAGLDDGSIPVPRSGDTREALYMVHVPAQTTVTFGSFISCVDFAGYHASARRAGREVAYAVVASCSGLVDGQSDLDGRELVSSHELIEAATDPWPDNRPAYQIHDVTNPWITLGEEVADLCQRGDDIEVWKESGFVAQRSWSNLAAASGEDPCVPGQQEPYFTAYTARSPALRIRPGDRASVELRGWLTGADDPFTWQLQISSDHPQDAGFVFSREQLDTGTPTMLDIDVSPSARVGEVIHFYVFSDREGSDSYQVLPMFAVVGEPCSRFTDCLACSSRIGCGFCASSGRCEAIGTSGSAESSCAGSSFAITPGSCSGFCASGGTSCADCTALRGCGWCASGGGQCVEASPDGGRPEHGSCRYADWAAAPSYCE